MQQQPRGPIAIAKGLQNTALFGDSPLGGK
jgi:hypothetical protein